MCQKQQEKQDEVMSIDRMIYDYYKRKFLAEKLAKDEGLRYELEKDKVGLLKKIDKQTSDKQSILQSVAGNFISDGIIFVLRKLVFK